MKIKPTDYKNIIKRYNDTQNISKKSSEKLKKDGTSIKNKDSAVRHEDDISISDDYMIYKKAMGKLMNSNEEKIKVLAAKIESGTYQTSPKEIAQSIIKHIKK